MGLFTDGFKELKKASEPLYKTPKSIQETIEKKEIEEIMDDVRENDQCLYYVAVTIILMADFKEELDSMTETVETMRTMLTQSLALLMPFNVKVSLR